MQASTASANQQGVLRHARFPIPWVLAGLALVAAGTPGGGVRENTLARLAQVVGQPAAVLVEDGDTLLDVAFRHHVGFEALLRANPGVDVWIPDPGTVVRLPSPIILPDVPLEGIVVNVPEMRLYDFRAEPGPEILAVAVGDTEDPTPLGTLWIGSKRENPIWNVPASILREKPDLPPRVPPGPDNPLGTRWLTIGNTSYGLHGTNVRWSVGREATHGCVRLYEDDVRRLYDRTPEGTRLQLVYQPFKWGRVGNQILLEVHPDLYGRMADRLAHALALPRELGLLGALDLERVWRAVEQQGGIPVPVGTLPPALSPDVPTSSPSS